MCTVRMYAKCLYPWQGVTSDCFHSGHGTLRINKIENVGRVTQFLKGKKVSLENIGPEDIVDGRPRLLLGLIWIIILRFQVQEIEMQVVCVCVCVCVCALCVCVWCIQLRFFREYIMCPHVHLMTDPAMCISFHIHTYIRIYCLMASIHAIVLPPPSTLAICSYKHTQTDSSLAYTHNWVCIPVTCT